MSIIERRICDICRNEFARHPETNEFIGCNRIDDFIDLCNDCLSKVKKFSKALTRQGERRR